MSSLLLTNTRPFYETHSGFVWVSCSSKHRGRWKTLCMHWVTYTLYSATRGYKAAWRKRNFRPKRKWQFCTFIFYSYKLIFIDFNTYPCCAVMLGYYNNNNNNNNNNVYWLSGWQSCTDYGGSLSRFSLGGLHGKHAVTPLLSHLSPFLTWTAVACFCGSLLLSLLHLFLFLLNLGRVRVK